MATFAELLRRHRHAAGLTMEQLTERSGVSTRAISDMERGYSRGPQRRTLVALADALGVSGAARDELVAAAKAGRRRPATSAPGACELPRGAADFTGRSAELAWLAGVEGVAVVSGPPGLGKTALAVHAARTLPDFPDGRFFVDLRGLDAEPVPPVEALGRLLRALGVPERRLPKGLAERSGLFGSLAVGRRCVVVLDNALDEAQVRPLLPPPGRTVVLITSRRPLSGLEAVARLPLAPLPPAESADLLRTITGQDAPEVAELARLCGHLPLALRIAGNRLVSRPGWTVAHLADRLGDEERRLGALTAGDLRVGAAFALSYRQLSPSAQRVFRRLGLVEGPDTGVPMASVLAQAGLDDADDALEELVELGLLQSSAAGRYQFHDLIRLFARQRLVEEETPAERGAAQARMRAWLLDNALRAGRFFEPGGPPADGGDGLVELAGAAEAQLWLEAEHPHWMAALRAAAARGEHRLVVDVAEAMHWFSDRYLHWTSWVEVYALSHEAAVALGDARLTVVHLNYLAWALSVCGGRHEEGVARASEARRLARELGDVGQQAWAVQYTALAYDQLGELETALERAREAAELFLAAGDWNGRPQALARVAYCLRGLGRLAEAAEAFQLVLDEIAVPGREPSPLVAQMTEGYAAMFQGEAWSALGRTDEAVALFRRALPLLEGFGRTRGVAQVRYWLGRELVRSGRDGEGREHLRAAAELYARLGEDEEAGEVRALLDRS